MIRLILLYVILLLPLAADLTSCGTHIGGNLITNRLI
jgi:hypothetical protein